MADKLTGNNQVPNPDSGEGDAPQSVTIEQVNQIVHAAITARNRALESKLDSQFAELRNLMAPPQTQEEPTSRVGKVDAKTQMLETQLKQMQAERARRRDSELRNAVKDQLMAAGVNPSTIKALVAMHVDADKSVGYASDESDEIVFKTRDSVYSLQEGVGKWLQSDEAKAYLAPKGATGSGDRSYFKTNNTNQSSGKPPSRQSVGNMLANALIGLPSGNSGFPTDGEE